MLLWVRVAVLLQLPALCHLWHVYDPSSNLEGCPEEHTRPVASGGMDDLRLWPDIISAHDKANGKVAYKFYEAMDIIYKHQHPRDCSKAKFLITEGFSSGFGSEIHIEGFSLAIAMASGRILLPRPNQLDEHRFHINDQACSVNNNRDPMDRNSLYPSGDNANIWNKRLVSGNNSFTTTGCYYEAYTNCSFVLEGRPRLFKTTEEDIRHFVNTGALLQSFGGAFRNQKVMRLMPGIHLEFKMLIPQQILALFKSATSPAASSQCKPKFRPISLTTEKFGLVQYEDPVARYYWRAMSSAYIMRPNEFTRESIRKYRDKTMDRLNGNCVSMYIRHGDKGREMRLLSFREYAEVAIALYQKKLVPNSGDNNNSSRKFVGTIYLATDNKSVFVEAMDWGRTNRFDIKFSALLPEVLNFTGVGYGPGTKKYHPRKEGYAHHPLEYLSVLVNLSNMMKCGAYVCTLASNFCRLLDELRATIGGKAQAVFADIGSSCNNEGRPCLDGESWNGKGQKDWDW